MTFDHAFVPIHRIVPHIEYSGCILRAMKKKNTTPTSDQQPNVLLIFITFLEELRYEYT